MKEGMNATYGILSKLFRGVHGKREEATRMSACFSLIAPT